MSAWHERNEKEVFFSRISLGMREGVGEDSRHGIGYVDIQVGTCIFLSVCLCWIIACALRWGVTHVRYFHYRALLTLPRDHYFRYRDCLRRRRSLEVDFQKKVGLCL